MSGVLASAVEPAESARPEQAAQFLSRLGTHWARHIAAIGPPRHQPKPAREPFEALVRAVAYQQLHARAGDAILARLLALFPGVDFPAPTQLLNADPDALRACGLSASKLASIQGLAAGAISGVVPTREATAGMADSALIERLTTLRGVGRWTVEMLLIYTLARADILPADDFGVRDGYRRLMGLEALPTPKAMAGIGLAWSPHRTIAAWYLWRVPKA